MTIYPRRTLKLSLKERVNALIKDVGTEGRGERTEIRLDSEPPELIGKK